MTGESSNLKATLSRFQLSNLDLARATGIDPSLISRYISGNRKLKKDSWQAEEIAEFLLMKADTSEKIEWLKDQFEASKLPVDIQSVLGMKRNLIQWIASDKGVPADDPAERHRQQPAQDGDGERLGAEDALDVAGTCAERAKHADLPRAFDDVHRHEVDEADEPDSDNRHADDGEHTRERVVRGEVGGLFDVVDLIRNRVPGGAKGVFGPGRQ